MQTHLPLATSRHSVLHSLHKLRVYLPLGAAVVLRCTGGVSQGHFSPFLLKASYVLMVETVGACTRTRLALGAACSGVDGTARTLGRVDVGVEGKADVAVAAESSSSKDNVALWRCTEVPAQGT